MTSLYNIASRLVGRLPPAARFLAGRQLQNRIFQKYGWGVAALVGAQGILFGIETAMELDRITRYTYKNGVQIASGYYEPLARPLRLWMQSGCWVLLLVVVLLTLAVPLSDLILRRRPGGGLIALRGWPVPPHQLWLGTWLPCAGAMGMVLAGQTAAAALCRAIYQLAPEAARLGAV